MSSAVSSLHVSGIAKQKLRALRSQARSAGVTPEEYAKKLIEDAISLEQEARTQSFDQLFAPVQQHFRQSGMTEQELDEMVDTARTRHHRRTSRKKA